MSALDPTNLPKLKVAELKEHLQARGLSTDGKKEDLVRRLTAAITSNSEAAAAENNVAAQQGKKDDDEAAGINGAGNTEISTGIETLVKIVNELGPFRIKLTHWT